MPQHNTQFRYDDLALVTVQKSAGAEINVEETIPADSTDLEIVGFSVDVSALKSIYIHSDKALTLETDSGSTPTETLAVPAGVPLVWTDDMPSAMRPFQSDVASLFVTEGASVAAALKIKTLQDPTP